MLTVPFLTHLLLALQSLIGMIQFITKEFIVVSAANIMLSISSDGRHIICGTEEVGRKNCSLKLSLLHRGIKKGSVGNKKCIPLTVKRKRCE